MKRLLLFALGISGALRAQEPQKDTTKHKLATVVVTGTRLSDVDERTPSQVEQLDLHKNVPGVLRDINRIVSDRGANILGQVLSTDAQIGYLLMDMQIDGKLSQEVAGAMSDLSTNIRTRVLN